MTEADLIDNPTARFHMGATLIGRDYAIDGEVVDIFANLAAAILTAAVYHPEWAAWWVANIRCVNPGGQQKVADGVIAFLPIIGETR